MVFEEKELEFIVDEYHMDMRADKFLSVVCDDLSRSRIRGLIDDGQVFVGGRVLKTPSLKTKEGDVFNVRIPALVDGDPIAQDIDLDIVYEDDDLLVINKKAGMVVHPAAGNWDNTLVNALLYHCGDSLSGIGGVMRPGIVHRLDKDTSGLILVAKNDFAHQSLSQQLADRSLSRIYIALVLGVPIPIKGSVNRPIGRHRHNRLKMSVMSNSLKDACTHYKVIKNYGDALSLVECKLETGRTHQIRVHMEAIGHCLIGDPLYGPQKTAVIGKMKKAGYNIEVINDFVEFSRQFLLAKEVSFIHPRSCEVMSFGCDFPDDMSKILSKLN